MSQHAAEKAAALVDSAEEGERNALERSLLDNASRFQSEAEAYERSVQNTLASAEEAAKRVAAAAAAGAAGTSPAGDVGEAAAVEEKTIESLRNVHERAIAAMEAQNENKRQAVARKLAQRRAAARAARVEALRGAGKSDDEITKDLIEVSTILYTRAERTGIKTYRSLLQEEQGAGNVGWETIMKVCVMRSGGFHRTFESWPG